MRSIVVLVASLACGSSVDPATEPRSIEITAPSAGKAIDLGVGVQFRLPVVVKNAAGSVIASDDRLTFVSRNPSVASVDNTGLVSGVGLGATYVIVALPLDGGTLQDSIAVIVAKNVSNTGPSNHFSAAQHSRWRLRDAAYRFIWAVAGNFENAEEAIRALYAKEDARLEKLMEHWPDDVREHVLRLVGEAWREDEALSG